MINSSSNNITWSKRKTFIILLHELLTIRKSQHPTIATHSLSNQKCWMRFRRIIKNRRVELYELHILYRSLCSINHCNTIASSYLRIRCHCVDCPHSTCSHEGYLTQEGIYLFRFRIEDIRTITFYIWGSTCHLYTQVVLRDNLNSIVIFEDCNIWVISHRLHQSTLYFKARIVSMMKNTEVAVPSFTM